MKKDVERSKVLDYVTAHKLILKHIADSGMSYNKFAQMHNLHYPSLVNFKNHPDIVRNTLCENLLNIIGYKVVSSGITHYFQVKPVREMNPVETNDNGKKDKGNVVRRNRTIKGN